MSVLHFNFPLICSVSRWTVLSSEETGFEEEHDGNESNYNEDPGNSDVVFLLLTFTDVVDVIVFLVGPFAKVKDSVDHYVDDAG
jgi:hypothetical protein